MDIYNYINSPDVAEYCRKIGKTWNTCEMAVIIDRCYCLLEEKHKAFRELISSYPDMPSIPNLHGISFSSIHDTLVKKMTYENWLIEVFNTSETNVVYTYKTGNIKGDKYINDGIFSSIDYVTSYVSDSYENNEANYVRVNRSYINREDSIIEAEYNFTGNLYWIRMWNGGSEFNEMQVLDLAELFYIDIPVPFKKGDVLIMAEKFPYYNEPFVLEGCIHEDDEKTKLMAIDGSDMIAWGFFVNENGILHGDHTTSYDSLVYYNGKFEGNYRLLHYLNLYFNEKLGLPEFVAMQNRIMIEKILNHNLHINWHGISVPDELLAENQITQEEKS